MSKVSFNFEIMPLSADSLSVREAGKHDVVILSGDRAECLVVLEVLGGVFLTLPRSDRRLFKSSVVCFINQVLSAPGVLDELLGGAGQLPPCVWSQTKRPPRSGGTLH